MGYTVMKIKPGCRYFSADGNFVVTLMTKATIQHDGLIIWEPPVIYKSACIIDVEYFPFDLQSCRMKFGSWTYDGNEIDLVHMCAENETSSSIIQNGISFADFYPNVEWDVLQGTAIKNLKKYPCCPEPYIDVTFEITIRRKTLFHTVNLILPCVAISFLTVVVFYLPSDSGEKITLCISILLSLTVFFLLLAEIIPPTSIVIPLIGKYLLFTMTAVTLSIVATIVTIRIHFRSPSTQTMSSWVKCLFLVILPKIMLMKRPKKEPCMTTKHSTSNCNGYTTVRANLARENGMSHEFLLDDEKMGEGSGESSMDVDLSIFQEQLKSRNLDLKKLDRIVNHLKKQDRDLSVSININILLNVYSQINA
jgi:nicotinic acetylcholine receptor